MLPYIDLFRHSIPTYGLCMVMGFFSATIYSCRRAIKNQCVRDENDFIIIAAGTFAAAILGAKIMFLFSSYGILRLFHEITGGNFSALWQDGLVYYGGLLGGIFTSVFLVKRFNLNLNLFCEAVVPCLPLGHMFGRIGCGCAGCCYGIPYEGLGAIHIATSAGEALSLFPVQFLEAFLNFALFVGLLLYTRKFHTGIRTLSLYLILYGTIRFCLEFLRGDIIRGRFFALSTSQWISVILIALITCIEVRWPMPSKKNLGKQSNTFTG